MIQMNLSQSRNRDTKVRTNIWTPRRERRGGMNWEIEIDIYTRLCTNWITNENLLYSTASSAPCLW